jgi:hypothetical protein
MTKKNAAKNEAATEEQPPVEQSSGFKKGDRVKFNGRDAEICYVHTDGKVDVETIG